MIFLFYYYSVLFGGVDFVFLLVDLVQVFV